MKSQKRQAVPPPEQVIDQYRHRRRRLRWVRVILWAGIVIETASMFCWARMATEIESSLDTLWESARLHAPQIDSAFLALMAETSRLQQAAMWPPMLVVFHALVIAAIAVVLIHSYYDRKFDVILAMWDKIQALEEQPRAGKEP